MVSKGTALILTFFFIVLLTMEVALIALIAQRSLGEEGVMLADNIQARQGLSVAMSQAERELYSYIRQNGSGNVTVDFSYGGSAAITDQDIMSTDPENAGAGETVDTGMDISAWVSDRRGMWYKVTAVAKISQVELISHKWVRINPCNTSGTLTTIVTGQNFPGWWSTLLGPDGRVYFGGGTSLWSWKDGVLSTLYTGTWPGAGAIGLSPNNKLFFGESADPGGLFAWKEGEGLTTIVTGENYPGFGGWDWGRLHITSDDRVYFTSNDLDTLWTYKDGVLSTLITGETFLGEDAHAMAPDGRFFIGQFGNPDEFWTYHPSTGLDVILSGQTNPGYQGTMVDSTGRVFIASSGHFWTWKNSVLSTILDISGHPGRWNSYVGPDDRVYFGRSGTSSRFWTWQSGAGLSTIITGGADLGRQNVSFAPDGRVYFGEDEAGGKYWTWKEGEGLTTIFSSGETSPGLYSSAAGPDGRVILGENAGAAASSFWTYKDGVLSTLLNNVTLPGWTTSGFTADGRAFFGENNSPGSFWTWKDGVLSTIVTGVNKPGNITRATNPSEDAPSDPGYLVSDEYGRVYFGEYSNPGSFYVWEPPTPCDIR